LGLGCCLACAAAAQPGAAIDVGAERARIAAERAVVEQRYAAAQADCQSRFLVSRCLEAARAQRREALDQLQRQVSLLDDADRRERAALRLQAIEQRDADLAPRKVAPASAAPRAAAASAPASRGAPQQPAKPEAAASAVAARKAREAQRKAQYERRQAAAREHQRALEARNASRDARRKPAAGLPLPGSGASAP
jgi:hypothetical protein